MRYFNRAAVVMLIWVLASFRSNFEYLIPPANYWLVSAVWVAFVSCMLALATFIVVILSYKDSDDY